MPLLDLTRALVSLEPFPHVCFSQLIAAGLCREVERALWAAAGWERRDHEKYAYDVLRFGRGSRATIGLLIDELAAVSTDLARLLGLAPGALTDVRAHHLRNGDRIGIHSDQRLPSEVYRLILHVAEPTHQGGELVLHRLEQEKMHEAKVVAPVLGTGFLFALGVPSYHSVRVVERAAAHGRLTLVATYGAAE